MGGVIIYNRRQATGYYKMRGWKLMQQEMTVLVVADYNSSTSYDCLIIMRAPVFPFSNVAMPVRLAFVAKVGITSVQDKLSSLSSSFCIFVCPGLPDFSSHSLDYGVHAKGTAVLNASDRAVESKES